MNTERGTLIVRRARAEDKPAVVEFCSRIWEGWDYLPRVYDRWLEDPRGAFLVAELAGRPVGTDKITVLSPGEIWLEGLRVDPDTRGRGVARAINCRAMEVIAGLNPRTVRFGTVADNWASRHMGEKDGFRLLFECRRMVAGQPVEKPNPELISETSAEPAAAPDGGPSPDSVPETSPELTVEPGPEVASQMSAEPALGPQQESSLKRTAGPEDLDAVMDFLEGSEHRRLMRGLYGWGWTFQAMSREFVEQVLARGGGLVVRQNDDIEALALFLPQRHGPRFCLGFIDGGHEAMIELGRRFRAIAEERGAAGIFAMVPERAGKALTEAGFRQEYPIEIVVYELSGPRFGAALKKVSGEIGSGDGNE